MCWHMCFVKEHIIIIIVFYVVITIRLKWEVIRTMQLFLEHVLLKHEFENSVAYLIRLQLVS